jgi:ribonuclease HI
MLTGETIFAHGPYPDGTVNIGEFLAIVDGMKFLVQQGRPYRVIYSDSRTGRARVRDGAINTTLPYTGHNDALFALVDQAIDRLKTQDMRQRDIRSWDTNSRGEIPADFGRK